MNSLWNGFYSSIKEDVSAASDDPTVEETRSLLSIVFF
jgi:hypothetical protein